MIKNIAYFPSQAAMNSVPVMQALLNSLAGQGITAVPNSMDSDAAVIWSVLWSGRMASNQTVYEHYRSQNKPVVIVEVGALHRGHTWKVSVNHVTAAGYYGHQIDLDWDRPKKLGVALRHSKSTNPEIVIALQHAKSLQVAGLDIYQWIRDQVLVLRQHTDRPIKIRPHPRSPIVIPADLTVQRPKHVAGSYDSFDLDLGCHAVVNFNSGPGIQAAIAGCRPLVDISSLASPVGIAAKDIENTYDVDRSQWLMEICHTEYTVDELENGLWLKRIKEVL
jgi:hypothetical protein